MAKKAPLDDILMLQIIKTAKPKYKDEKQAINRMGILLRRLVSTMESTTRPSAGLRSTLKWF